MAVKSVKTDKKERIIEAQEKKKILLLIILLDQNLWKIM